MSADPKPRLFLTAPEPLFSFSYYYLPPGRKKAQRGAQSGSRDSSGGGCCSCLIERANSNLAAAAGRTYQAWKTDRRKQPSSKSFADMVRAAAAGRAQSHRRPAAARMGLCGALPRRGRKLDGPPAGRGSQQGSASPGGSRQSLGVIRPPSRASQACPGRRAEGRAGHLRAGTPRRRRRLPDDHSAGPQVTPEAQRRAAASKGRGGLLPASPPSLAAADRRRLRLPLPFPLLG